MLFNLAQDNPAMHWWQDPAVQKTFMVNPIKVIVVLALAWIIDRLCRRLINQAVESNASKPKKSHGSTTLPFSLEKGLVEDDPRSEALQHAQFVRRQSRIKTLASVGRSAASIVIWVLAIITCLDIIGINIGPLIASAGVVGVAIGFGAQSLVKDFISGIFMLLEDQYGVGDTIDVGKDIVGTVEDISLRVTTLRDIDGTLWYVRNGEILRVGNFSDKFSIARVDVPVALSNDSETTGRIILDCAKAAVQDPAIHSKILDAPVLNGVTSISTDHMDYRVSVKVLPGAQWKVARRIQTEMVNYLRKQGVKMVYEQGLTVTPDAEEK